MNEVLYDLMDWAGIEALVYSEEDDPHRILGPHMTDRGLLVQAFIPGAASAAVCTDEETYPMEAADEHGFFAALLPVKQIPEYTLQISFADGRTLQTGDPYRYGQVLDNQDLIKFDAGICYHIYDLLGAHPCEIDGVKGVSFAVWAPNALRVSLVGDFNAWDGRILPMRRIKEHGIFELFVPGMAEGSVYKYEIKAKGGLTYLKSDPYAFQFEKAPGDASVVADIRGFNWTDSDWMSRRGECCGADAPVNIYEVDLGTFAGKAGINYRELAAEIAAYVLEKGYTHIQLLPVMEYPEDSSYGYQTSGFYAPTSRYGMPHDFMCFINYMHAKGIGVILDWVPSHFTRHDFSLGGFDGTCLYEHLDPRQGIHPLWNTFLFNYGRAQVSNFLLGSALFWGKVYHADGLRIHELSSILYLDYGKSDGQWVANYYGGNENLEGLEFIKHLSSIFHKQVDGAMLIASESRGWPGLTAPLDEEGLGFDYKWNGSYIEDLISYMQLDPIFRGRHHDELTFSMVYQYSEKYILPMSHEQIIFGNGSFFKKMPGKPESKAANVKAMLGYLFTHPGKKLVFMGQDFGQKEDWDYDRPILWEKSKEPPFSGIAAFAGDLFRLYRSAPALSRLDNYAEGFEWINSISANENMLVFLRRSEKEDETLLVVCNFSALVYEQRKIGVPFAGKFKEILNSDLEKYGGSGHTNPRVKVSRPDECDGRAESIRITVPPLGICIFSCTRVDRPVSENDQARTKQKKKAARGVRKIAAPRKRDVSLREELARKVEEEG